MRTFNNKHRGFKINMVEVNPDRVEYKVMKDDGTIVEDTEGFCVTIDEALATCEDIIDDILDN